MMQAHNRWLLSEFLGKHCWSWVSISLVDALPARDIRGSKVRQSQAATDADECTNVISQPCAQKAKRYGERKTEKS
jgi:hypothetical protein